MSKGLGTSGVQWSVNISFRAMSSGLRQYFQVLSSYSTIYTPGVLVITVSSGLAVFGSRDLTGLNWNLGTSISASLMVILVLSCWAESSPSAMTVRASADK